MDHMEFSIALPVDASTTRAGYEWEGMKERLLAHLHHSSGGHNVTPSRGAKGSFLARVAGQQVQDITAECRMGVEEAGRFVHALYLLEDRCVPFLFILYNRFRFFTCRQKVPTADAPQGFDSFLAELQMWAQNCEFGDLRDILLKDCIITGIHDDAARHCLLRTEGLDLVKTLQICRAVERMHRVRDSSAGPDKAQACATQDAAVMTDCGAQVCSEHNFKVSNSQCDLEELTLSEGILNVIKESLNLFKGSHHMSESGNVCRPQGSSSVLQSEPREKLLGPSEESVVEGATCGRSSLDINQDDTQMMFSSQSSQELVAHSMVDNQHLCELSGNMQMPHSQSETIMAIPAQGSANVQELDNIRQQDDGTVDIEQCPTILTTSKRRASSVCSENSSTLSQRKTSGVNNCNVNEQSFSNCFRYSFTVEKGTNDSNCISFTNSDTLTSPHKDPKCLQTEGSKSNFEEQEGSLELTNFQDEKMIDTKQSVKKKIKFKTSEDLHVKAQNQLHGCNICSAQFKNKGHLRVHLRVHSGDRPFSCAICGAAFSEKSKLTKHQRKHTGEKPYTCATCNKQFSWRAAYARHLRIHTGERCYTCEFCGVSFTHSTALSRHVRIHTREKPYPCEKCAKTYPDSTGLKCQCQCQSTQLEQRPYVCNTCGAAFRRSSHLQEHVRLHTGDRPHTCEVCGVKFSEASKLKAHRRRHTGERPYTCEVCGASFSWTAALTRHKRTHTLEKPYSCSTCGKTFADHSTRTRHARTHTGERPFPCTQCNQYFADSSSLRRHQRTHSAEKSYTCEICGAGFSVKGYLVRHSRIHSGNRPHACGICGAKFMDNSKLKRHAKIH
ncbi:hypothetical protein EGW08_005339, partial [Elysia chlorotica]